MACCRDTEAKEGKKERGKTLEYNRTGLRSSCADQDGSRGLMHTTGMYAARSPDKQFAAVAVKNPSFFFFFYYARDVSELEVPEPPGKLSTPYWIALL